MNFFPLIYEAVGLVNYSRGSNYFKNRYRVIKPRFDFIWNPYLDFIYNSQS